MAEKRPRSPAQMESARKNLRKGNPRAFSKLDAPPAVSSQASPPAAKKKTYRAPSQTKEPKAPRKPPAKAPRKPAPPSEPAAPEFPVKRKGAVERVLEDIFG